MKKVTIFLKPYSFLCNNAEYDLHGLSEAVSLSNISMKVVILGEPLFIKIFEIKKDRKKMSSFIQDKIDNIFPQNGEILYDYEKNNVGDLLAIYSVKGKRKIEKLSSNAKELEVIPIQLMVRDELIKVMKNKKLTCSIIFKVQQNFYYLYIKNGLLCENFINEDLNEILQKILQEDISEIYVDQNIDINQNIDFENNHKDNVKLIKINMGELMNEKIFEK